MREREPLIRPKTPDILRVPFVEGLHPYTMMFVFLAYDQRAYKKLSPLQREVFDRYYTDGLTIEGQYDFIGRGNLEITIQKGFSILREYVNEEVRIAFREGVLPQFKESDYPYLIGEKEERKKRGYANSSIKQKGRIRSQEVKNKISKGQRQKWQDETYRRTIVNNIRQRSSVSDETRRKLSETRRKMWQDPAYRSKTLKVLERAREKARNQH